MHLIEVHIWNGLTVTWLDLGIHAAVRDVGFGFSVLILCFDILLDRKICLWIFLPIDFYDQMYVLYLFVINNSLSSLLIEVVWFRYLLLCRHILYTIGKFSLSIRALLFYVFSIISIEVMVMSSVCSDKWLNKISVSEFHYLRI